MEQVTLWNGKSAPRMGIGTWVMGGQQYWEGKPTGWAGVDDAQSRATLAAAFDAGIRIIDTADQYGGGHSEEVIAQAITDSPLPRDAFVICTKVGMECDGATRNLIGPNDDPAYIERAIDGSLARLGVDHLDLVFFHLNYHPLDKAGPVMEVFARAYEAGKIGGFGWSTDDVDGALHFADMPGFAAIQHDQNLICQSPAMRDALDAAGLWAFHRQPLAMGLLSGKFTADSPALDKTDVRASGLEWLTYFNADGTPSAQMLERLDQIRAVLMADGRTLAQGALGWCLAQSGRSIPLPGCRTVAQARDNFGTLDVGPLGADAVAEIDRLLRTPGVDVFTRVEA